MPLGLHPTTTCPRCAEALVFLRPGSIDAVCTNPDCSFPNPEPGPITAIRVRLKGRANDFLQALRERDLWPPSP